jgi:pimeloyl-ACP methyl ester carboxylesterase
MNIYLKNWLKSASFIILFSAILTACSTNDNPEPEVKNYKKVLSMTVESMQSFLIFAGQTQLAGQINYPVDIYSYNYPMNYQGKTITASGLICVPVTNGDNFPVVSFQHGTLVAKNEAPSASFSSVTSISIASLSGLGYILLIPDLIGFGASFEYFHPYLIKKNNVDAVTAMLGSLSDLPNGALSGTNPNDSLFLAGYSEGGWITLAAMQEIENNNNGWNLIGTACGAGPYNPEQLMQYVLQQESYPRPFFLAYVLLSFVEDGTITQGMEHYFNPPYAEKIPILFDGTLNGAAIDVELNTNTHELMQAGLFTYQQGSDYNELIASFNTNKVDAWQNQTPLLLLHGTNDTYIPQELSDSIYSQFNALGSNQVQYETIPFTDHNSAATPAIVRSIDWFQQLRNKSEISLTSIN